MGSVDHVFVFVHVCLPYVCSSVGESWQIDQLWRSFGTAACASVFISRLTFIPRQRRGGLKGRGRVREGGRCEGLMVRKVGGSRGNPPCVSCHWRSARRIPAQDCTVWCIEDTSHVLFLLSLLLSFSLFSCSLSQAVSHKRCPFSKWGQREQEREEHRFENRSHV